MAERNGSDQKCGGGKNVIIKEEKRLGNEDGEGWIEEKGLEKKENGEKGKVEEEEINGISRNKMKWWGRNLIGLEDWEWEWEWPPYPWSLEEKEKMALVTWDSNPYWDIELMHGTRWGYEEEDDEEIIWEDDVWHLRDIKEVPLKTINKIRGSQ